MPEKMDPSPPANPPGGSLRTGEGRVLEMIATGASLDEALGALLRTVEEQAKGMLCSVLTYDGSARQLRHAIATSLPLEYYQALGSVPLGAKGGCYGLAAESRDRVVVFDLLVDPLFERYREIAVRAGLRACWVQPIVSSHGSLLGVFAMYYDQPRGPTASEGGLIEVAAHLAGIALERNFAEESRRRLEARIQQVQKLESLAVLAGGIAHQFNNLLQGILGNASLALMEMTESAPAFEFIEQIEAQTLRAAELAKEMLAFSGRGQYFFHPIDLSRLAREMMEFLEVSISTNATLEYELSDDPTMVEADSTQIRQAIMNLVTNASDALGDMPGRIRLRTGVMDVDHRYLASTYVDDQLSEGRYAYLEVADDGCGMDPDTLSRIFDPFFSTKFGGRGLGLAAVLGIVRGHRGAIKVDSAPSEGAKVRILLPASIPVAAERPPKPIVKKDWEETPTIIVVDDEESVLDVARRTLERQRFRVLIARSGREAVDTFDARSDDVDLVLVDLMMPGMGGEQVCELIRSISPKVPIVLMSGYDAMEAANRYEGWGFADFLQKPFLPAFLVEKIKNVLTRAE